MAIKNWLLIAITASFLGLASFGASAAPDLPDPPDPDDLPKPPEPNPDEGKWWDPLGFFSDDDDDDDSRHPHGHKPPGHQKHKKDH